MIGQIQHLLQWPQGAWMQYIGGLKRSTGKLLHIASLEYAGKCAMLEGIVLSSGGISRAEALRLVGGFSAPLQPPSAKPRPKTPAGCR